MKAPKITVAELRTGDALLYEKTIAIGRIEQIFTRSKFNHSSLLEVKNREVLCYEAIWPKVVCRTIKDSVVHTEMVIVKRPRFAFDEVKYLEYCKEQVGKKYDLAGLLCQIPHQLWGGWIGNKSMKKVYCSKLNAWVWMKLQNLYPYSWFKISPDELFEDLLDFDTYLLELPIV